MMATVWLSFVAPLADADSAISLFLYGDDYLVTCFDRAAFLLRFFRVDERAFCGDQILIILVLVVTWVLNSSVNFIVCKPP